MNTTNPFRPKKSLGQNFLIDPNIIGKIIKSCKLKPTDTVVEIGPGKGALTELLSKSCKRVLAVEKDRHLADQLKFQFDGTNVEIIQADILKYPFDKWPGKVKVIGNLPYNIATPIIKKIIDHRGQFDSFYLTVQLEYGQRMVAKPNSASYGSFSCFVQFYTDVQLLFKIGSMSFRPAPKVKSCFLQMTFLKNPKYKVKSEDELFKIIRRCFGQRRKTIGNSLANASNKKNIINILNTLDIDPKLRAENLDLNDFVRIANATGK